MAHADGVGVGKRQAQLAADLAMVLADHVQFAAQILGRHLHARQDLAGDEFFELGVEHGSTVGLWTVYQYVKTARRNIGSFTLRMDSRSCCQPLVGQPLCFIESGSRLDVQRARPRRAYAAPLAR